MEDIFCGFCGNVKVSDEHGTCLHCKGKGTPPKEDPKFIFCSDCGDKLPKVGTCLQGCRQI